MNNQATRSLHILPTSDLVHQFCQSIGVQLDQKDTFELLAQIYTVLDIKTPYDVREHEVLVLDRFVFLAHYPSGQIPHGIAQNIFKAGYALLVQVFVRMTENNLISEPGKVDHMPYLMVGNDVCLSHLES